MANKKYIAESEKLIIENFHSVMSKIDPTYSEITERLSPEFKDAAYNAADVKFNSTDYETNSLHKNKYDKQRDLFSKHVNPEVTNFVNKLTNDKGLYVSIEKRRPSKEAEPYIILYFSNFYEEPSEYKFNFKVIIQKDKYEVKHNDSGERINIGYFERPLLRIIEKLQNTEFVK